MEETIEIALVKGRLAKPLVFSTLALTSGIWLIIANPQIDNPLLNNLIVKFLVFGGATAMGALGIYFFAYQLFDKGPVLVLNGLGIYNNTSIFRFGLIPWSDISEVYDGSIQASVFSKQHFITIGLTNPNKYISREKNILKRKLLEANAKHYGSPIHISASGLETNHKDLLNLIKDRFEKFRDEKAH